MWRGYWRFLLPYRIGRCRRRAFAHSCSGARQEFDRFFLCEEQHRVLDAILHFLHSLYNPDGLKELIRSGGAPLICAIVFVETGFFVGFFLPGDSLEVASHAGYVLCHRGRSDWLLDWPFGRCGSISPRRLFLLPPQPPSTRP